MFDRIPAWKRLQQIPSELQELKTRVAALEEKLAEEATGERLPQLTAFQKRGLPADVCHEGWTASQEGKPMDANPYPAGSPMFEGWHRGWRAQDTAKKQGK